MKKYGGSSEGGDRLALGARVVQCVTHTIKPSDACAGPRTVPVNKNR